MTSRPKLTPVPKLENHMCFGCSPNNPYGLNMTFSTDNDALYSRISVPGHLCGWDRLVHGGVISTILDEIMGWSAIYLLKTISLTKSMSVEFIKPVYIETQLKVVGKFIKWGKKREALMEAFLYNDQDELCARADGVLMILSQKLSKRLNIIDEETLAALFPSIDPH
jgi:acyl-coenzyme A thioesterase PaaI-like protein